MITFTAAPSRCGTRRPPAAAISDRWLAPSLLVFILPSSSSVPRTSIFYPTHHTHQQNGPQTRRLLPFRRRLPVRLFNQPHGEVMSHTRNRYIPWTEESGEITACGIPINYNASKEWADKKVVLFSVPG